MTLDEVKRKFEAIQVSMKDVATQFPWEDKEAYVSWLAQTYEYATFTTRILALTGAHFPLKQTALASRFIQHATEEKGHDKLLVNDAKALGYDLDSVKLLPEAEAFHKSVYYWIYQGHTAVIMGWVLFLEGFAVNYGPLLHERAERAHGKKPTSFLRVHTQEDPDHVEKALSALTHFSADELAEVAHGLELYAGLYSSLYAAIVRESQKVSRRAA